MSDTRKIDFCTEPKDSRGLDVGMFVKDAIRRAAIARHPGYEEPIEEYMGVFDIPYSDAELRLARLEYNGDEESVRTFRPKHPQASYDRDVRCYVRDLLLLSAFSAAEGENPLDNE